MTREETWKKVMEIGKKETRVKYKYCNSLSKDEIASIVGTMDFFGATSRLIDDTIYMLGGVGKFRVYDWLATEIDSLNRGKDEEPNITPLKVITYAYVKSNGDINKFIQNLRETDYQIVTDWETIDL